MKFDVNFGRWQANFGAGLAVVLPAVISIAILVWLFGGVANITDKPLFFLRFLLEKDQIYASPGVVYWWWRLFGFLLSVLAISLIGDLARHYVGRKLIRLVDYTMLRIPLLNKIYGATKQVNDAFTSNNKSSFKQVVMVEFPHPGLFSIGFITGDHHHEIQAKTGEKIVSLFIPTTPNPTTGFLIFVPEHKITRLAMPVSDGIKYIISLGSVSPIVLPGYSTIPAPLPAPETAATPNEDLPSAASNR